MFRSSIRRSGSRRLVVAGSVAVTGLFFNSPLMAQTTVMLPAADANATYPGSPTSFRYSSNGTLYAWNGQTVYQQVGSTFDPIGMAQPNNSADPGAINVSADGTQILFSNGAGGPTGGTNNGELFSLATPATVPVVTQPLPTATVAVTLPNNFDFIPVPASSPLYGAGKSYFVDIANGTSSSVVLYNFSNNTSESVITNIPGASASLTINPRNNSLYVVNGYDYSSDSGPNGSDDTGDIRSFNLSTLTGAAMTFSQGTVFDTAGFGAQGGNGLFFDRDGYLFSDGQNGITVFNSQGAIVYQQDPTGSFTDDAYIAYDPATDQVLQSSTDPANADNATLYSAVSFEQVPEPTSFTMLAVGSVLALGRRRKHRFENRV